MMESQGKLGQAGKIEKFHKVSHYQGKLHKGRTIMGHSLMTSYKFDSKLTNSFLQNWLFTHIKKCKKKLCEIIFKCVL